MVAGARGVAVSAGLPSATREPIGPEDPLYGPSLATPLARKLLSTAFRKKGSAAKRSSTVGLAAFPLLLSPFGSLARASLHATTEGHFQGKNRIFLRKTALRKSVTQIKFADSNGRLAYPGKENNDVSICLH